CPLFFFVVVMHSYARGLRSFPTRRSSDLDEDYHASSEQLINKFFNERELLKNGARAEILDDSQPWTWYEHTFIIYNDQYHDFDRSEEHTSELQSRFDLVCRLLLAKKKEPR